MFTLLIVVHIIICMSLIMVVLMQSSKGEGLAGAFGGGGLSGAVFGGRGAATFLSKATTILAILFMFSCIALTFVSRGTTATQTGESAVQRLSGQQQQTAPVTPPIQTQTQPTNPQSTQQSTQQPATQPPKTAKDSGK